MIGIVWFDDANRGREGWSCNINGKAERIHSHGDLNQTTVWICNIPRRQFDSLALNAVPYLRCNDYFKSRLDHVSDELGLKSVSPKIRVMTLFSIFNKAIKRLAAKYTIELPGYRFHEAFTDQVLVDAFRERPTCKGMDSSLLEYIFTNATQYNQASSGRQIPKGSKACRFRFVRGPYYRYLAEQDCPANNTWKYKDLKTPIVLGRTHQGPVQSHQSSLTKLENYRKEYYCLAQVEIQKCDPSFSQFYTFGVSGFTNKAPRRWAPLDEIIEMSAFTQIKVTSILFTEKTSIKEHLKFDPVYDACYSDGLYRETLYKALMEHPSSTKTALSACLSSHERIFTGKVAAAFFNAGFTIGSFGSGLVTLFIRGASDPNNFSSEVKKAVQVGFNFGLLPNADLIPSAKASDAIEFNITSQPLLPIDEQKLKSFTVNPFLHTIRKIAPDKFDMPYLVNQLEIVFGSGQREQIVEQIKDFGKNFTKELSAIGR